MKPLRFSQKITYSVPQIALALTGAMIVPWLTYFYVPADADAPGLADRAPLVSAWVFAAILLGGRVVDAIADPFIGYWSDRCRLRMGRRRPFMLFGTPILALSFGALWFPPFEPGSTANAIYFGAAMFVFWVAFTAVVAPYVALLPEITTTTKSRVELSSYMGVFMVLGVVASALLIGPMHSAYPDGLDLLGLHIDTGIQAVALITTGVTAVVFLIPLANIREAPRTARQKVPPGLIRGVRTAYANPAFQTFLAIATFVQMGLIMMVTALPYICTQILERHPDEPGLVPHGQGEAWTGYLMAVLVVCALLWIPVINGVVRRWGKKRLMILTGYGFGMVALGLTTLPLFPDPAIPMILLVVAMSLPAAVAMILVNPLYADVVDYDEQRTGVRREGIYTGATALLGKLSIGVASYAVVLLLPLGSSRANPLGLVLIGPIAAALIFGGTWLFSHHPIEK